MYESQTARVAAILSGMTYWGDYGGDILSRFHYNTLLNNLPNVVQHESQMWGQSLALKAGPLPSSELHMLIEFIAWADPNNYEGMQNYPLYEVFEDFSEWEWNLTQKEMTDGWWGENALSEVRDALERLWPDNFFLPTEKSWGDVLSYEFNVDKDNYCEEPYWESADSLVAPDWDSEQVAMHIIEQYAEELSKAGNPAPIDWS